MRVNRRIFRQIEGSECLDIIVLDGGGVYNDGTLVIDASTVAGNTAAGNVMGEVRGDVRGDDKSCRPRRAW